MEEMEMTATAGGGAVEVTISGKKEVEQDGILAVMFDRDAAAVCNQNYRVTSIYNPRGEYTNYFYKWDAMYMNDTAENVVVFYIADESQSGGDGGDGQE